MAKLTPLAGKPLLSISLDVPTWPEELTKREHNRIARTALTETLEFHHRHVLPGHFKVGAATKYGYMPRSEKYKRAKLRKYRSITDLVATGQTKRQFLAGPPKIVISGSAMSARGFAGRIELGGFPFLQAAARAMGMKRWVPKRRRKGIVATLAEAFKVLLPERQKTGVTIDQMRKEITCFTAEEAKSTAARFLNRYMWHLNLLIGRKNRKVIGGKASRRAG